MPDQFTPNYSLTLPEIGASRDSWGAKWNANLTTIDQLLFIGMPIGMLADFAGPQPPSGWLVCDGRLLSRTTYSALFAAIGTAWGAGDGTTTFALPNLAGRSGVGPGTVTDSHGQTATLAFAQSIGNIAYQIGQAHLPNYPIYTDAQGWHSHGGATVNAGGHAHSTDAQGNHNHGGAAQWSQTGIYITDPGHQHGYYMPSLYGGAGLQAGNNYVTSTIGVLTSSNGTGITLSDPGHVHGITYDGYHAHNVSFVGDHAHGIYGDGQHSHTIYLGGSGTWFPVVNPILVVTKIIFAGTQAAVRVMSMAADDTMPMTIEGESEELLDIREELRQLRQLLTTMRGPAQQRRIAAPLRGPH